MGYYTYFDLNVHGELPDGKTLEDLQDEVAEKADYGKGSLFDGGSYKWYSHDEDMLNFSKEYPELRFELSGIGEENEDIWRCYYVNGKKQFCPAIITFDEFDESKLA